MTTLPAAAIGAEVMAEPACQSATGARQRSLPLLRSSAIRTPSSAPTYSVSSRTAAPRLTATKPFMRNLGGSSRVQVHSDRPVLPSMAETMLGAVMYKTPSMAIGVVSVRELDIWTVQPTFGEAT